MVHRLLERYLESRCEGEVGTVEFGRDDKIDGCIKTAVAGRSFTYSDDKKGNARKICDEMTPGDLDRLDLKEWIKRVHDAIAAWNEG
jgi:hypothetical protein